MDPSEKVSGPAVVAHLASSWIKNGSAESRCVAARWPAPRTSAFRRHHENQINGLGGCTDGRIGRPRFSAVKEHVFNVGTGLSKALRRAERALDLQQREEARVDAGQRC